MKFGIMLHHYRQVASVDGILRVAQEAESMGYHSIWTSDHIVVPSGFEERFGKGYYDALSVLGYVSAVTKRVRLGTSIVIVPLRHPLQLAQVAATVDQLSKGRLILGLGVGSAEPEYHALGALWEERGAVTDEALQVLKHVWTVESPNYQGHYFNFVDINSFPPPVQRPHPPIWIGGGSLRSIRRAAEYGDAWHPTRPSFEHLAQGVPRLRRQLRRAGRDPDAIEIAVRHPMKVTERAVGPIAGYHPGCWDARSVAVGGHRGADYRKGGTFSGARRWPPGDGHLLRHPRASRGDSGLDGEYHGAVRPGRHVQVPRVMTLVTGEVAAGEVQFRAVVTAGSALRARVDFSRTMIWFEKRRQLKERYAHSSYA